MVTLAATRRSRVRDHESAYLTGISDLLDAISSGFNPFAED